MTQETPTTKDWLTPQIEEVTLEAEEDVLATCFTASMTTKSTGASNTCNSGGPSPCATFP